MGFFILPLCFPSHATVQTATGVKIMSDVKIGDTVKVMEGDKTVAFSTVYGWAHRDQAQDAEFVELLTAAGGKIVLSPDHLIPTVREKQGHHIHLHRHHEGEEEVKFVMAGDLIVGDQVLQLFSFRTKESSGQTGPFEERLQSVRITGTRRVQSRGIFAPLTMTGTVVVDGVAASCYAATKSHTAAHAALAPARAAYRVHPQSMERHHEDREGKQFKGALNYVDRLARVKART